MIYFRGHPILSAKIAWYDALHLIYAWTASLSVPVRRARAIKNITERRVLTLRKVYGYSHEQIAAKMNMTHEEVETHLTNAAKHIAG